MENFPRQVYPKSALVEAVRLVTEENMPLATAAEKCQVPKATLYCRVNKTSYPKKKPEDEENG